MPHVEHHAAPARLERILLHVAVEAAHDLHLPVVIHVRVHVARPHPVQQLLTRRAARVGEDLIVHHHGHIGQPPGGHGAVKRVPAWLAEMRHLDAYHHVAIGFDRRCRLVRQHVFDVVFRRRTNHPLAGDIEQREHARVRLADHLGAKVVERPVARAACIHHRRGAGE